MVVKIVWSEFSKSELKSIFYFYKENASEKVADKIVTGITEGTKKLLLHNYLGQEEELLKENPSKIRYLIYSNYKILYRVSIENKIIEILDIFDTRQNPSKITREK